MNKKFLTPLIIIFIVAIVTATTIFIFPYQPNQPPQANNTGSTQQGVQEIVDANNKFAFDIYSELNKNKTKNIFYSPYSISAALAMTYEGAKNQTKNEISSVFHFPSINILRPNFAEIYNNINKNTKNYELKTGNALWLQKDYPFLENYINNIEEYYGGKAANLNFIGETEKSRQTINEFIKKQTNNKIKNLISKGILSSMTRLVITNAIYFKGTWKWEFDKTETSEQNFKITQNNIVKTLMMYMKPEEAEFNYANLEDLQILEMPYKGEEISMLILLPQENLDVIESNLTMEKIKQWKNKMNKTKLDSIYLPKFEFETKYDLDENLKALGMTTAFNPEEADFSGMTLAEKLFISKVIHQAYIKVDEKGTEAAAATAVTVGATAMPNEKIFRADHPFIFIIQEKETGNILFLGKILNPNK